MICLKSYKINDLIIAFSFRPHSQNVIHSLKKKKKLNELFDCFGLWRGRAELIPVFCSALR